MLILMMMVMESRISLTHSTKNTESQDSDGDGW